jgi:hypothetical protein
MSRDWVVGFWQVLWVHLMQMALMRIVVRNFLRAGVVFGLLALTPMGQGAVVTNRAPLLPARFAALPLGSVRPQGWLLSECQEQRDGLTGQAEAVYASDLGSNSAWLGGTGESWERGPYYLKGLIPLAYVLDDPALKATAQKWIDAILRSQRPDGSIGPASNNDWWPRMIATYALRDYYEATGDARVPTFLDNYFRYMLANLPGRPLVDWGKARAGDEIDTALWLYNRNGDTHLLALSSLLRAQAYDWVGIFSSNSFDWFGTDFQPKHNVNIEQALKFPLVCYQLSHDAADRDALYRGLNHLMQDHGLPFAINAGTEFVSGNASIQAVELCATVEAMLSLETALQITGDPALGDRLEMIAYNALPAGLANDCKALQYYTLPNNVIITNGGHGYGQDYANGSVPGPDSGFPCCRYNFHMGWPKLVQNSWAATSDGGLAALAYAPTFVHASLGGEDVRITEETQYPFEEQIRFKVALDQPAYFPIEWRIPGWCSNATITVNGEPQSGIAPSSFYRIARTWKNGETVTLNLPMRIETQTGPEQSVAIHRGPLAYSLKIGEQWNVSAPDPLGLGFDEFHVAPTTPWAYALQLDDDNPSASFTFSNRPFAGNPFRPANTPVSLTAQARPIPNWTVGWLGTHAFEPPYSPTTSTNPLETVNLVPFGSQHLRLAWFPWLGDPAPISGSWNESFDSTWARRWTVFGGNWFVRDHTLHTAPGSVNGPKAIAMGTDFTNVVFDANVSVGPKGNAGIIFRVSKPDIGSDTYCGYYAGINAGESQIEFGYATNVWRPLYTSHRTILPNTAYHLRIDAQGPRIRLYWQDMGNPVADVLNDTFTHGAVGLREFCLDPNQAISSFANVSVYETSPARRLDTRPAGAPVIDLTQAGAARPN